MTPFSPLNPVSDNFICPCCSSEELDIIFIKTVEFINGKRHKFRIKCSVCDFEESLYRISQHPTFKPWPTIQKDKEKYATVDPDE